MSKRPKAGKRASERAADPDGLTTTERAFVLHYQANGGNATRAYLAVHPKVTEESAAVAGYRLLRNAKVKAVLDRDQAKRWKALQMDGDEAAARMALNARVDIRRFYNAQGVLLKPQEWPDDIAGSVKAVAEGPYGLKLTLIDPLVAQRVVLELTGKIKGGGDIGELATLLARHYKGDAT